MSDDLVKQAREWRGAMLGEKSGEVTDLRRRIEELEAKNKELEAKISEMFDAAQQVHRDGGRELARLATEAYDHD